MPKMLTLGIHLLLINMKNILNINSKIKPFSKKLLLRVTKVFLLGGLYFHLTIGKSTAYNLLKSEDVLNTLDCLKTCVKVKLYNNRCEIIG